MWWRFECNWKVFYSDLKTSRKGNFRWQKSFQMSKSEIEKLGSSKLNNFSLSPSVNEWIDVNSHNFCYIIVHEAIQHFFLSPLDPTWHRRCFLSSVEIFTDTKNNSHWLQYLIYANLFHNTHIFRIWWYFHWVARWMIKSHEKGLKL